MTLIPELPDFDIEFAQEPVATGETPLLPIEDTYFDVYEELNKLTIYGPLNK